MDMLQRARSAAAMLLTAAGMLFAQGALAQATRTWVSGVGDDANPCSRTAPCKTFAGAITKTAAGGEIDALDSAGYGGFTITKSITINGTPFQAGVLVSGTNGIIINAAATDTVILKGLDVEGLGTGLSAIRVLVAKAVFVHDVRINAFTTAAVDVQTAADTTLTLDNVTVNRCAGAGPSPGVWLRPTAGKVQAALSRVRVSNCGSALAAEPSGVSTTVAALVSDSVFAHGTTGVTATGAGASVWLSNSDVFGNATGLAASSGAVLTSYNNNRLRGNTADGAPTNTVYQR